MVPYVYVENERVLALPTGQSEKSPKPNYFDGVFWREDRQALLVFAWTCFQN